VKKFRNPAAEPIAAKAATEARSSVPPKTPGLAEDRRAFPRTESA